MLIEKKGDVSVQDWMIDQNGEFSCDGLKEITGRLTVDGLAGLTKLDLSDLETIGDSTEIVNNDDLKDIDLSGLKTSKYLKFGSNGQNDGLDEIRLDSYENNAGTHLNLLLSFSVVI